MPGLYVFTFVAAPHVAYLVHLGLIPGLFWQTPPGLRKDLVNVIRVAGSFRGAAHSATDMRFNILVGTLTRSSVNERITPYACNVSSCEASGAASSCHCRPPWSGWLLHHINTARTGTVSVSHHVL